jgi:hypothetical protein
METKFVVKKLIKLKSFIYLCLHNIWNTLKKPFNGIALIHDKLQQPFEIKEQVNPSPYSILYDWIVEIFQYGLLYAFVYFDLFIFTGLWKWVLFPLTLGIIRWLYLDFVKNTTDAIKGNN